jgi:hypothetical protein
MARFSAFIVARGFRFPPRSTVTANRSSHHCQGFTYFDGVADCVWVAIAKPTEWQRVGDEIDAVFIVALAHFVGLDAHKQPDVPQKA